MRSSGASHDGAPAILPIGAAAKQHGFHLPLNTDRLQAEWLAARIAKPVDALIWPTLTYGHYPAFVEYAGSSSLSASTFEALVQEIAAEILGGGCRKLFVLNTGISTLAPVDRALARLDAVSVKHLWIHGGPRYPPCREGIGAAGPWHPCRRTRDLADAGAGAASRRHDARRSKPAVIKNTPGPLTPSDPNSPNYSRSGSYGDPTLATSAKGDTLLAAMLDDLNEHVAAFVAKPAAAEQGSGTMQSLLR